jgi:ketosteroid isomerase-like protein
MGAVRAIAKAQESLARIALARALEANPQLREIDNNDSLCPGLAGPPDGRVCQAWSMASANLELVQALIEAWNRQDDDSALKLLSTDVELDASGRVFNPDVYRGVDGLKRFRREIAEPWDRFQLDIEELLESGAQVVVYVRSIGRGRASGVEIDVRSAWLVTVSGHRSAGSGCIEIERRLSGPQGWRSRRFRLSAGSAARGN